VADRVISVRMEIEIDRARRNAKAYSAELRGIATAADTAGRSDKSMQRLGTATKNASTGLASMGNQNSRLAGVATSLKGIAAAGAAVAAVSIFKTVIGEAREAERTTRQTEAVIKSTGGAAGVTASQVSGLADKLSQKTAVDDEVIAHGENVLLTFKNIRNEAGRGNDIFSQTTAIALDMSAALSESGDASQGLQSNTVRLGKALNDPIAGISALTRVGVTFNAQQKEQIKSLVESGDIMGAQKLILSELKSEFGGMAEATADSIGKAQVSWANLAESVGQKVMPAVHAVSNWALHTGVPALGQVADTVGTVVTPAFHGLAAAGGGIISLWQSLPGPIQAGAIALGVWALAGDRVRGVLSSTTGPLRTFGQDVQTVMSASGGGVTRFGASLQVIQDRVPAIGRMGAAFRTAKGDVAGFGGTLRGVASAGFSGLKSAAGGLMGVLGGPWGLALAGAAAAVTFFAGKSAEAQKRQDELAGAGAHVAQVLREQKGAINEASIAAAAKDAEDQGLLDKAEQLGIKLPTVTSAILGQGTALDDLRAKLKAIVAANTEVDTSTGTTIETTNAQGEAARNMLNDLNSLAGGKDRDAAADQRRTDATKGVALAQSGAIPANDLYKQAIEATGAEFDQSADAGQQLANAIKGISDQQVSGIEAEEAYQTALRTMRTELNGNSNSLNINTATGQRNRDMLQDVASKIRDKTLADIQSGMPMNQALARHNQRIAALKREAGNTFAAKGEARKLIDAYGDIPKNVKTKLEQIGYSEVNAKLMDLSAKQFLLSEGRAVTPSNLRAVNWEKREGRGHAAGGEIHGPGGPTSDSVPIWASAGEFMQRASAVQYYGTPFMHALNQKRIPKNAVQGLAKGGQVWPFQIDLSKTKIPKVGGPALEWAVSQVGKPYIWGGVGPAGYDCSGFMSAITNVLQGRSPHSRRFATGSFPTSDFARGAGGFMIGAFRGSPGHMAGTLCIIGSMLIDGPNGPRRIDEIQAGEWVWSYDEGRRKPHQVVKAWFTARQDVFEVRMSKGRSVTGSANHPFLVARKQEDKHWGPVQTEEVDWTQPQGRQPYGAAGRDQCTMPNCDDPMLTYHLCRMHAQRFVTHGDPRKRRHLVPERWAVEWVPLDQLRKGDLVVRSRATEDTGTVTTLPDGREITEDTAWLVGHLVGDGNLVNRPGRIRVSCYRDDYRDRVLRAWKKLTGKDGHFYGYDASCPPVVLNDIPTHEVFRQMGMCVKGPQKRVPQVVWSWPRHLQQAFLDGYCDADGHYPSESKPYVRRRYGSASEQLIADVRAMHIAHGDGVSNVQHRKAGPNRSGFAGAGDAWSFDVYEGLDDAGGVGDRDGLRELVETWQGDYTLSRVQSVTPKGEQDTYDITVEGAHSFSVDGIQLHNSGVNVESRGGEGVVVGARARGAQDSMFGGNVWHLRGYRRGGQVEGDAPFDLLSPLGQHFDRRVRGSYRRGTNRVPMDGLYQLHRGEKVTPAHRASRDEIVLTVRGDGTRAADFVVDAIHKAQGTGRLTIRRAG
jgi:cell wall-associated NlpC family hydrolase